MFPAPNPRRRRMSRSTEMSARESWFGGCVSAIQKLQDCHFDFVTPDLRRRRPCSVILKDMNPQKTESFELFSRRRRKHKLRHRCRWEWAARMCSCGLNLRFTIYELRVKPH